MASRQQSDAPADRRQFEGPVLEDLLARVRAEVGADARIVAANRVRKGGIAGFFSRQAFEVLVEPSGATAAAGSGARAAVIIDPEPPVERPNFAATILDLADEVSNQERDDVIDLVEEHIVSTQSADFARILETFSRSIDPSPEELAGDDLRVHGLQVDELPGAIDPPAPFANEPRDVSPQVIDDDDLIAIAPSAPMSAPRRPNTRRVVRAPEVIDRFETRLSNLGLPARLIPRGVAAHEMKGALVESLLLQLPPAPSVPSGLGVVIVVVGASAAPVLMARDLAVELRLDPDDVVLVTRDPLGDGIPAWLQMSDADTAQARRRSWQRRERPTIVACSLPPQYQSMRWARAMLDQLEPTITWAIVDAGWKREDIAHRVEALGGVDVLALDHIDDTVSPATALELGIPVGRLGSEHASPLTWTELFLERMSETRAAP